MSNSNIVRPYMSHQDMGLNELRRLAQIKRQNTIKFDQERPVPHMAGSFGFK